MGLASNHVHQSLEHVANSDLTSVAVWPFDLPRLERSISVAVHEVHGQIHENLVAFLPGKAGSGASTAALHTARALLRHLERRVLVIEGDLHSGHLASTLRVEPRLPIRKVLADAPEIDNLTWDRCVSSVDGVDFLLTDTLVKEPIPSWAQYFQILRFAAPKYDMVLVDLPEIVNEATAEIVRSARAVYVVSTPELASLNCRSSDAGNSTAGVLKRIGSLRCSIAFTEAMSLRRTRKKFWNAPWRLHFRMTIGPCSGRLRVPGPSTSARR